METKSSDAIKLFVSLLVGVLLLVVLLWWIGVDKLLIVMGKANPIWLMVSALMIFPAYLLRALRWRFLLLPVKNQVKLGNAFWATAIGFMVNTLIPIRIGEFIRAYLLGERERIGFAPSFSSIIVERTLDLIGLLTLGLVAMLLLPIGTNLPSWILDGFKALGLLIGIVLAVIIVGIKREDIILGLTKKISAFLPILRKRADKIVEFVRSLISGLKGLSQSPKMFVANMALTWVLWLIYCLMVYFVFEAFNYSISVIAIILGGVLLNLTYILPAAPGYVGTYEAYWTLIFMTLGIVQTDLLLAMGLISHLLGVVMMIALGCIGIMWLGLSFSEAFKVKR
ncbi:MAG: hypothetical protein DRP00_04865 [Candidatus Aenigmatarchaeota archaeon]|nr:MAG: hypothetical protein DRP00_04865 [Candidatus Aenigmarchaeota archaeon]